MKDFLAIFTKRWILVTILVVIASIVLANLGFWQLDRLTQRQTFNAQVMTMRDAAPLRLTADTAISELVANPSLEANEFRHAVIEGEFDYANTIAIGNTVYDNQPGVNLLTPLRISGSDAVILVDRGWVPYADWQANDLDKYSQDTGIVRIEGMLRGSQERAGLRTCVDPQGQIDGQPLLVWCVNLADIAATLPYAVLDGYLTAEPTGNQSAPPYRSTVQIEISEGNHLSYAMQWFSFASLLFLGYPFFVRREEIARREKQHAQPAAEDEKQHTEVQSAMGGEAQI